MDTATIKLEIIKLISELQNERFLTWLLKVLKQRSPKELEISSSEPALEDPELVKLRELAKQPIPESIDLEQLKKEQGYDPKSLAATLKDWDYSLFEDDPPAEELIKMLSK